MLLFTGLVVPLSKCVAPSPASEHFGWRVCEHAGMHVHGLHCDLINDRPTLMASSKRCPFVCGNDFLTCRAYTLMCLYDSVCIDVYV